MNYLSGIPSVKGLGALNPYTSTQIRGHRDIIKRVLQQSQDLRGLGDSEAKKLSFDEVVAKYNKGITTRKSKHGSGTSAAWAFP